MNRLEVAEKIARGRLISLSAITGRVVIGTTIRYLFRPRGDSYEIREITREEALEILEL